MRCALQVLRRAGETNQVKTCARLLAPADPRARDLMTDKSHLSPEDPDDVFELTEILASGAYGSVYKVRALQWSLLDPSVVAAVFVGCVCWLDVGDG